jgi:glutamyl-Q tRNA(Asp) synthetase
LHTLDACGFEWDGEVIWQSRRSARYREVLEQLKTAGAAYPCGCSRADLAGTPHSVVGVDGAAVYPGTCRAGLPSGKTARAWRLRVAGSIVFNDAVQGVQTQDLPRQVGDLVLLRADGWFAYQLAVVVDDAEQGVDHVVRGADLIHSSARQIYLQRLLGYPTPAYAHLPVAVDASGHKLSKQTLAAPVNAQDPVPALLAAARFLGQHPPEALCRLASADFFNWAHAHWQLCQVPQVTTLPIEESTL